MEKRRHFTYKIAQPRDSITLPFTYEPTATHRDPQLYESQRVQPIADDRLPPVFIDLDAARRNESPFPIDYARYSTNTNGYRSSFEKEQQFIAAEKRKSLEETMENKKTKQPINLPRPSTSSPSRRKYRSNDSSCCCCCCFVSNNHNEPASDHHDSNDNCCECDNCCDNCCECDNCFECESCCDCESCAGECVPVCLAICFSCCFACVEQ